MWLFIQNHILSKPRWLKAWAQKRHGSRSSGSRSRVSRSRVRETPIWKAESHAYERQYLMHMKGRISCIWKAESHAYVCWVRTETQSPFSLEWWWWIFVIYAPGHGHATARKASASSCTAIASQLKYIVKDVCAHAARTSHNMQILSRKSRYRSRIETPWWGQSTWWSFPKHHAIFLCVHLGLYDD